MYDALAPVRTLPRTPTPDNHGRPWTDEHIALLVERIRAGDDLEALEAAVGRTRQGVLARLRRLLSPDNREHPADLALLAARDFLADPDADWKRNLITSTVPRPIIQPPAIIRSGYGGIPDGDLVVLAHALILAHGHRAAAVCGELLAQVRERNLTGTIASRRAEELRYEPGCHLNGADLWDAAQAWADGAIYPGGIRRYDGPYWDR